MDDMISEIKQVKQTLRYLTMIAEQACEGIAVVDLNGTVLYVNDAWARMHGYDNEKELYGKSMGAFHSEEQMRSDVVPFIEETKSRGRLEGPVEHVRKDGTVFTTRTKMTALKDEEGNVGGLVVFVTDVSSNKQTEELLRQQEARLAAVGEHLQRQITEHMRVENELQEYRNRSERRSAELTASNEKLRHQADEYNRLENELREYCNQLEQQIAEVTAAVNEVAQFATPDSQLLYQGTG